MDFSPKYYQTTNTVNKVKVTQQYPGLAQIFQLYITLLHNYSKNRIKNVTLIQTNVF